MTASTTPEQKVHRARVGLLGLFLLLGMSISSWLARLPSVREALGLSSSELGLVLLAGAVGSLIAVTLAGGLVQRFGGRAVLTVGALGILVSFVLEGLGPAIGSVPVLAVGIFLNGASVAITNVPQNVETAAVERRMGRAVLSQFHAAFSIGAVLGSLVGAACAAADVSLLVQFTVTGVVATVWRLLSIPHVILDTHLSDEVRWDRAVDARTARVRRAEIRAGVVVPEPGTTGARAAMSARTARLGAALGAWREPRTLYVGVVVLAAALSEGSANNWLNLAVVNDFGRTESVGALVFGGFVTAMTLVRLLGTRLIDSLGRVAVLRLSGAVSIVGLLLFGFAPSFPLACAGVLMWGAGAALAVPLGIAAASDDPLRAAARVSVVSAFASMASLAAPPLLGFAAEHVGERLALTSIVVAMVASVLLSRHVARETPEPAAASHPSEHAQAVDEAEAVRDVEIAVATTTVPTVPTDLTDPTDPEKP
ncbi:MFS transporter [Sanguibacter suaedae]|uniref:MFS transporter n=1 Tax=Sanguibacter suaedae TaxID=2795737 RepID=A0A934I9T4_9MICO|nr:MFS transporter [Sanguibacter suaedae]MBI9113993.1 MFS transporter [Sanguibacter suaedae]